MSKKRIVNFIYPCKNKLVGIDSVLPLLMELKKRYPDGSVVVFFSHEACYSKIRKNYHIWKALKSIEFQSFIVRRNNKIKQCIEWFRIIALMAFRKNIIINQKDILPYNAQFVAIMKRLSNTVEIKAFLWEWTIEYHELLEKVFAFGRSKNTNNSPSPTQTRNKNNRYDYYISSLNRPLLKKIYGIEVEKEKYHKIGYLKHLPAWSSFVNKEVASLQRQRERPYFVYFLSGLHDTTKYLYQPLEESLYVLKKYNQQIRTVFKPAFITKMDDFYNLVRKVDYGNYEISYAHPSIISYHAQFALAYIFTTALFNAFVMGKPVVVYTQHADPCHYDILGNQTVGGRACDCTIFQNPDQLDAILESLINNQLKIERDHEFLRENFPKTPPEFWNFWDDIV